MARLTLAERNLLRYPPTTTTWICQAKRMRDGVERVECGLPNFGLASKCWLCGTKKPSRVKLEWPRYVATCKKAGIEPGEKWPPKSTETAAPSPRKGRKR